jgi:hypothetical protein
MQKVRVHGTLTKVRKKTEKLEKLKKTSFQAEMGLKIFDKKKPLHPPQAMCVEVPAQRTLPYPRVDTAARTASLARRMLAYLAYRHRGQASHAPSDVSEEW